MSILKLNMNICVKWDTLIIAESTECLAKYNTVLAKKANGHIWILGGLTKFKEPSLTEEKDKGKKEKNKNFVRDEFTVVDIDFNAKILKPIQIKNKYNGLFNDFQLSRMGVEGQNDFIYFYEEDPSNDYANIYKVDEFTEKIIKVGINEALAYINSSS